MSKGTFHSLLVPHDSRNGKVLLSFVKHCEQHPNERFWQALRNWSGQRFILAVNHDEGIGMNDTFNWEGKDK